MTRLNRAALVVAAAIPLVVSAAALDAQRAASERSRDEWQKVAEIFTAMGVRPGAVVADVGAGDGYFTARLARAVGAGGRVYAVDVSARTLERLRQRLAGEEIANVEVVEGAADDPKLPAGALDAVLIVNAYHEMTEHRAMLAKIRTALKPDGRLVILEPIAKSRRDSARPDQVRSHEIGIEHVQQDARDAGFSVVLVQDPFTSRRHAGDDEWLLVLTPAKGVEVPRPYTLVNASEGIWCERPVARIGEVKMARIVVRYCAY